MTADTETIERLDLPMPCGANADCGYPASFDWCCGLCDFTAPTCDMHRYRMDQMVASGLVDQVLCNGCKRDTKGLFTWRTR